MKIISLLAVSAAVILTGFAGTAQAADAGYKLAITIDDLPSHGQVPPDMTRNGIGEATLAAFKAHKVPEVYGFINARHLAEEPGSVQVLKDWVAAGYPLGNHTSHHRNINTQTIEQFQADVVANEPILRELMGNRKWRYFRYPFLNAGDATRHDTAAAWLKTQGYTIADTSMSFNDWAYTDTYARCVAKKDTATIAAMKVRYMNEVRAQIVRTKAVSQKVYGRMIPQVLLTHIGGFGAIMLPDVLDELEKSGARFVTLDQAQADSAYGQPGPKSANGLVMERTAEEKGIDISAIPNTSVDGLDKLCR